jgi:hypothetical protein
MKRLIPEEYCRALPHGFLTGRLPYDSNVEASFYNGRSCRSEFHATVALSLAMERGGWDQRFVSMV